MPSHNLVLLVGNLCRDPEMRYTPKGTAVASLSLAVNRTWKGEDGEKKEEVAFIDCEAWGRTAEVITEYHKKGSPILVQGRLKLDSWEDKNTKEKRSKLKVVVESFSFIGGSEKREGAPKSQPKEASPSAPREDDSVPF